MRKAAGPCGRGARCGLAVYAMPFAARSPVPQTPTTKRATAPLDLLDLMKQTPVSLDTTHSLPLPASLGQRGAGQSDESVAQVAPLRSHRLLPLSEVEQHKMPPPEKRTTPERSTSAGPLRVLGRRVQNGSGATGARL